MLAAAANQVLEFSFKTAGSCRDPFNELALDVVFAAPGGGEKTVPAFWAGEGRWTVRFSSPECGVHTYRSVCSDTTNADLHGREGTIEVRPYEGSSSLFAHGGPSVSADKRFFRHADGTPFFWLADTWWMGLCRILRWPDEFRLLAADRRAKGFSVIQIVAGFYPDMHPSDERNTNEAGFPWTEGLESVNPSYFDMADLRIEHLVASGLVPCILGGWGYHLRFMGIEKMKRHWRYLVARYGAYPVIWCLAGEGSMPWYKSEDREAEQAFLKKGWTEAARYVRGIDPFRRPLTIHPSESARDVIEDDSLLDFDMLQTGHSGYQSMSDTLRLVRRAVNRRPRMPVINGEVSYEGIMEGCRQEVQRFMFWACMLSGACGHTYGANGVWQVNTEDNLLVSTHGASWGNTTWREAYQLPGSTQVGTARRILERFEWWRFEPHPQWVEDPGRENDFEGPFAAGIPGEVRVFYFWRRLTPWRKPPAVLGLEAGSVYNASFFDPATGREYPQGKALPDSRGAWQVPQPPILQDWVLALERLTALK